MKTLEEQIELAHKVLGVTVFGDTDQNKIIANNFLTYCGSTDNYYNKITKILVEEAMKNNDIIEESENNLSVKSHVVTNDAIRHIEFIKNKKSEENNDTPYRISTNIEYGSTLSDKIIKLAFDLGKLTVNTDVIIVDQTSLFIEDSRGRLDSSVYRSYYITRTGLLKTLNCMFGDNIEPLFPDIDKVCNHISSEYKDIIIPKNSFVYENMKTSILNIMWSDIIDYIADIGLHIGNGIGDNDIDVFKDYLDNEVIYNAIRDACENRYCFSFQLNEFDDNTAVFYKTTNKHIGYRTIMRRACNIFGYMLYDNQTCIVNDLKDLGCRFTDDVDEEDNIES